MTNRISFPAEDFKRMCNQAERDQESRKLVILMERVKKQIAERANPGLKLEGTKASVAPATANAQKIPSRGVPFER